jgi:HAD superfamily hydrolase (TIGR01484 family)
MKEGILICSDLDRTILPNGKAPQSPEALQILHRLAARQEITLAYVSGRDKKLLKEAIKDFKIPLPDYAIGDVGTTIYEPQSNWQPWTDYAEEIASDWHGKTSEDLKVFLADLIDLALQERDKQNTFKLSYYSDVAVDVARLKQEINERLVHANVQASLIWSIDEEKNIGLLDVLPERATKVHAIRFLMKKRGYSHEQVVFAGDSGNDLPALTSGLNAVLVKNGHEKVRKEARLVMEKRAMSERLYLAQGNFLGMNGNYCAGVLEGIAHFLPETIKWMKSSD